MTFTRVVAALLALVVCAWFGLSIRQSVDTSRATALIDRGQRLTPAQAERARSLLRSAGTLNPDLGVDLLRGQLTLNQGNPVVAERIDKSVVSREPLNLEAWVKLIYAATAARDVQTGEIAGRHAAELYSNPK